MLSAILHTGVYAPDQLESVCRALAAWQNVCRRAIVYLRLSGSLTLAALREATQEHCPQLQIIPGFEIGDGMFKCGWDDFYYSSQWNQIANVVARASQIFATPDVFLVHESPATNEVYHGKEMSTGNKYTPPIPYESVEASMKLLRGKRIWIDIPKVGSAKEYDGRFTEKTKAWIKSVQRGNPHWLNILVPKFQWAVAYPGTYDYRDDPDGEQTKFRQWHVGAVGQRNFHDRIFVSETGLAADWPALGYDHFDADDAYRFVQRGAATVPIIYTKQSDVEAVGLRMKQLMGQ